MTSPARITQPRDRLGAAMRPALLVFVLSILLLEIPGAHERITAPFSGIETQNLTVQNVRADGPNVEASPWELEAARGNPPPKDGSTGGSKDR